MSAWAYDDGGRADAGFRGTADDCVVRAIAIATEQPYGDVYAELAARVKAWATTGRRTKRKAKHNVTPRNGVVPDVYRPYLEAFLGWHWTPTMRIGSGTTVHLRRDELPAGRLIANCSRHLVAVVDGMVRDTHDPTRNGTRAVYGYWSPKVSR